MLAVRNKVDVQTLISPAILAQTVASKVFEVYPPAPLMRRVGCKIILGAGRTLADSSDVLRALDGTIAIMLMPPGIVLLLGSPFANSRPFTAEQKAESHQ